MKKLDIIKKISEKTNLQKEEAQVVFNKFLEKIKEELLNNGRIEIRGFGVFGIKTKKGGVVRNPKTGIKLTVPDRRKLYFKPSKELKKAIMENDSK